MAELGEVLPVVKACQELMDTLDCDFVGLAFQNKIGPDIKWHVAVGNKNDKYNRSTVRYGKGIAGKVIASGRPLMITDFPNDIHGKILEHPIMLAEQLVSAYSAPMFFNGVPKGVLLVGKRSSYSFSDNEQAIVNKAAKSLEETVKISITF
ncbi:GAF domain-containing protein [Bacillus sp. V59.32b]|uniref:GAF domain-containing protein n=1 Tax=Bacillus sp. V59.32b TaxID=1758642 RepID=UPI000E3C6319|nr:GAF domain-containing protein [Bacillus sp. V59.32b]RFU69478.1 GAF domain-containing protein [Bacillus sp. V59.32b]